MNKANGSSAFTAIRTAERAAVPLALRTQSDTPTVDEPAFRFRRTLNGLLVKSNRTSEITHFNF